jgi:GntR family transcriptional regulator/MocR family aminotransferase
MYPWKSTIQIARNSTQPVYLQVANAIIKEIHEGRLLPGQKLPGARVFSELLRLNRKTITAAMEELYSQGWVESYAHKGTFVSERLPEVAYTPLGNKGLSRKLEVSRMPVNDFPFLESLHLDYKNKRLIDDGVPDVTLAPLNILFKYHRSLLNKKIFKSLLKYNHVEGDLDLRTTLKFYLRNTRGIVTTEHNIFITRGSQMGIYISLATLVQKGDSCITSSPGYPIVDTIIQHLGGKVAHVPVDAEGIITKDIEAICKRKKIRLLYITPHHHYPTTVTLSPVRRLELLQLAARYNFYILEDDYAYDFHYSNNPVMPLASLNKSRHVIYIGSFSKCLSPSVRVGYFVAPVEVMETANKLRRIIDRQGDPLLERSLSEFIKSGDLQRHLKKIVRLYKQRRDYFCHLLEKHLGKHVSFVKPEGGMSVWITFRDKKALKNLPDRLAQKGYVLDSDPGFMEKFSSVRTGFASLSEEEMDKYIGVLKDVLSK